MMMTMVMVMMMMTMTTVMMMVVRLKVLTVMSIHMMMMMVNHQEYDPESDVYDDDALQRVRVTSESCNLAARGEVVTRVLTCRLSKASTSHRKPTKATNSQQKPQDESSTSEPWLWCMQQFW